jgi:hypothetical protein
MKWLMENYEAVLGIVASTLAVVAAIAKLTPSPKDDGFVAKCLGWLNLIPKAK